MEYNLSLLPHTEKPTLAQSQVAAHLLLVCTELRGSSPLEGHCQGTDLVVVGATL
jgi:hypothetical protein